MQCLVFTMYVLSLKVQYYSTREEGHTFQVSNAGQRAKLSGATQATRFQGLYLAKGCFVTFTVWHL